MKRTERIALFLGMTLFLLWSAVYADVSVYIHNRPFSGPVMKVARDFYVPLHLFAKAFGAGVRQEGMVICLLPRGGVSCPFQESEKSGSQMVLYSGGKRVDKAVLTKGGQNWIPLREAALGLGAEYHYSPATGIIDVIAPRSVAATPQPAASPVAGSDKKEDSEKKEDSQKVKDEGTSAEKDKGAKDKDKGKEKDKDKDKAAQEDKEKKEEKIPLEVAKLDFRDDSFTTKEVRVSAVVKNISSKSVDNAVIILSLLDGNDKPVHQEKRPLGTVGMRQTATAEFYWLNYTGIKLKPKIDFEMPKK
ncbi:MAG: hypothetical protein HYU64_03490 [Armatimonadetes bacterium]|nr:hypothetical protein [Armatimonadota bacterium]